MTKAAIEMGPIAKRIASNITRLRQINDLSQQELCDRLAIVENPLWASAVSRIETLNRRVDVDDLVALAVALGVTPNDLILPIPSDTDEYVELTPTMIVKLRDAWRWANGKAPLPNVKNTKARKDMVLVSADELEALREDAWKYRDLK